MEMREPRRREDLIYQDHLQPWALVKRDRIALRVLRIMLEDSLEMGQLRLLLLQHRREELRWEEVNTDKQDPKVDLQVKNKCSSLQTNRTIKEELDKEGAPSSSQGNPHNKVLLR